MDIEPLLPIATKFWIRYWGLTLLLIALCIAVMVAGLIYYTRRRALKNLSRKPASGARGNHRLVEPPEPPSIAAKTVHIDVPPELPPVAENFNGLYGALHKVASGQVKGRTGYNVIRDWERRIQQTRAVFISSAWNELILSTTGARFVTETFSDQSISAIAKGWLEQMSKWGVCADPRSRFRIDEGVCERYHFDGDFDLGDTAVPQLPCWTLGEQVVQKGLAVVVRT
jgi:hypothetical protein